MTKLITRKMLEDMGINIEYDADKNDYIVTRTGKVASSTKKTSTRVIKEQVAVGKHKYVADKYYPIYGWSYNGKPFVITKNRLIYAWFKGEVPAGYDVDHIDNNPFNNDINNLQLLTRQQNIVKRLSDNKTSHFNHYELESYKHNKKIYDSILSEYMLKNYERCYNLCMNCNDSDSFKEWLCMNTKYKQEFDNILNMSNIMLTYEVHKQHMLNMLK